MPTYQATILKEFDDRVGIANTSLYNGIELAAKYRLANDEDHPYYGNQDFVNGSIFYDGSYFSDVKLKLNVYENELLTKIEHELSSGTLILIKNKVDRFYMYSKEYTFLNFKENGVDFEGYCEVLFESKNMVLLKKYNKKRFQLLREGNVFYEFKNAKSQYILKFLNSHYLIKNPSDFKNIFPEFKEEYRLYFNKRLYKNDKDSHLVSLVGKMNDFYRKQREIIQE
ncbi:hypothetical protein [Allomuricauda sp. d1]|uniref:hypothetical protein n=1 Tax=Allomuricauda sp. d1 TaxID=3136725 RepID=UPI0031D44388